MKTAVVILNWNTRELLQKFLPGLIESCEGHDAKVIVADNASTDGSMEMMEKEFPQLRTIRFSANYGFTGGYDRALSEVDAQYYVLMNSDVEVRPDWLSPLTQWMDSHPRCGACAPKLLSWYERDTFEYAGAAGGMIDSLGYTFCRGRVMKMVEKDHGQYDTPADVLWATGACLMVRSSVWKELAGLDDRFFAHMEEIDLCWRTQLRGWKVQTVPQSVVYHLGGATLPSTSPWKLQLNFRNNLLLLENNLAMTYALDGRKARIAYVQARCTISARRMLDICSAAVYLLTGHPDYCRAVFKGHGEYRKLRRKVSVKDLQEYVSAFGSKASVSGRYTGWIVPEAAMLKEKFFERIHI